MRRWRCVCLLLVPLTAGCSLIVGGDGCDDEWRVFEIGAKSQPLESVVDATPSVG